jgi:tRNA-dihydrouridine synthase A
MSFQNRPHCLSVAPMMDRTDRHCRYLLRLVAPNAWLYTEMVTAQGIVRGDAGRLLAFNDIEHPVAAQLGGSDPRILASATRLVDRAGYDEVNLNVGCPSDRVQAGCFGAALMARPQRVADCVRAMCDATRLPVTVKTRLGIDEHDSYEFLCDFVAAVKSAGCRTLIVHARKAWLKGLSPKENRSVPALDYSRVRRLKRDFPDLEVILNGGVESQAVAVAELRHVDGVMLGRAAYHNPWLLAALDARLNGSLPPQPRDVLAALMRYAEVEMRCGVSLRAITRHWMGFYAGRPGARRWRRFLGELPDGQAGLRALRAHLDDAIRSAGNAVCVERVDRTLL